MQIILRIGVLVIMAGCGGNEGSETKESTMGKSTSSKEKSTTPGVVSAGGKGITGAWNLRMEVFDDNANRIPDPEELKKSYSNRYHLQLNPDGSCRIQQMFSGRYERVTEDGRDMLKVYRKRIEGEEDTDPLPDIYQVTSLKNDEMILQIITAGHPSSFWYFDRVAAK